NPAEKLPKYDVVPAFTMTDSQGGAFTQAQMDGKVWVVDFIYTNCPAECPRMSSQMHKLEAQVGNWRDQVKLLSISVDPDRDTPAALNAFAKRFGAPNEQWRFVTGDAGSVHLLAFQTFHIGDVLGKIEHSIKFALVDKHRTIRGYYSSFDQEDMTALVKDADVLRRERS
ncbi:MAG TPA: SCO family protein, partial [Candidatus Acidoferrum sp.]|nr:SCO family protein [Candidatus Acidoferrum sp.]